MGKPFPGLAQAPLVPGRGATPGRATFHRKELA